MLYKYIYSQRRVYIFDRFVSQLERTTKPHQERGRTDLFSDTSRVMTPSPIWSKSPDLVANPVKIRLYEISVFSRGTIIGFPEYGHGTLLLSPY